MQQFILKQELSTKITPERLRSWRWSTAASNIPKKSITGFMPIGNPLLGDLALVQVISIGSHSVIEESTGGRLSIFPGSIFVGTFGNRYAPDEYEGVIPDKLDENNTVDLLNVGGVIGKVLSGNSIKGEATKLKVLAFLKDKNEKIANTLNYPIKSEENSNKPKNCNLIVVTGTSMNSGKSNTAKAITYSLTCAGKSVVAGKVTGTAAKKDILLMKTAGAIEVCDFTSFGYPSTYLLDHEKMLNLFWDIYNYLKNKSEDNGYIVLEIADGIFQREAEILLNNQTIKDTIDYLAFSCCDSLSAVAGIERIENKIGIKVSAISGPAANSKLGHNEIRRFFTKVPIFNNMILDVQSIAEIFTKEPKNKEEIDILPESIISDTINPFK